MQSDRFYVLLMIILLIISLVIRYIVYVRMTNKNPIVVGKGKTGFAKYREELSVFALDLALIFVILFCLYKSLDGYFPFVRILNLFTFKILGSLTIMVGYIFILIAIIQMGKSWRIGIDVKTKDALITKGIFFISRNPIFMGIILYFAGIFLIFPNWIFGLILFLTILGLHWQIIEEERFLKVRYGKGYEVYSIQTGRYLSIKCLTRRWS